jgi:NADH:ubiquinone oxidoreductase subunit 5 (subunit L)/multisubunit Na+/H+ antiporter MnhA subunit
VIYAAFFKEPKPAHDTHHAGHDHSGVNSLLRTPYSKLNEAPAMMVVPLVLTAIGAIALFFAPSTFLELAKIVVSSVTGEN